MSNKRRGHGRLPKAGVGLLVAATAISAAPGLAGAAGGRPVGTGGGRGGGESTIANNLSNPVVFADNVGILGAYNTTPDSSSGVPTATWTGLRIPSGPGGTPTYGYSTTFNGVTVYPQAVAENSWQATWGANTDPTGTKVGTLADWGDNILGSNGTVKSFSLNTAIRVEVKLAADGSPPVSSGIYQTMTNNGLTGSSEKFAADKPSMTEFAATTAPPETVFTGGATMALTGITDPTYSRTFPVDVTFVSSTETETGGRTGGTAPMRLAGEVNASGNVVYGLNLFPAQLGMKAGAEYKITFSIASDFADAAAGGGLYPSGAKLDNVVTGDLGPGRADFNGSATSVAFKITGTQSGQRGGGGSGTGGGGSGTGGGGGVARGPGGGSR